MDIQTRIEIYQSVIDTDKKHNSKPNLKVQL